MHCLVECCAAAMQEDRDRQIAELNAESQKLAERLEQREHELTDIIEDLRTQLQVTDTQLLLSFTEY